MSTAAEEVQLRQLLGETISEDMAESDSLFTNEEVTGLINRNPSLERAAFEGWRIKAARLGNLVDTTEGNAQRKFGQLLGNALDMVKLYQRSSDGPTEGRTRIGRIVRSSDPGW